MKKVFCFGELLLRLSPALGGEWIKNACMPVYIGGAELNAAKALAKWEVPVGYGTAIPDHALSKEILVYLEERNVDTSRIIFSGNRIGCYYLPQGADLKNSGVIYDRDYSSFSQLKPGQIDWDKVLQDISWFHFSAISPALNEDVADVCKEALMAAERKGITISVDLNYRARLWQYGKSPLDVMPELVKYCDIIMGNLWAKEIMLGIELPEDMPAEKNAYIQQSQKASSQVMEQYPKCRQVAHTFRFDVDGGVLYYATLYDGRQLYVSKEHSTPYIIDKVGSGDTFMAGLIYGNYNAMPNQEIIDFSAAAAFNKLFIKGDAITATVEQIMKGNDNDA